MGVYIGENIALVSRDVSYLSNQPGDHAMKHRFAMLLSISVCAALLCSGGATYAQTEEDSDTPRVHTVEPELFEVEISLDGVFEAATMEEIVLRPEEWNSFRMIRALNHGDGVNKDGILIWIDTREIDEAIREAETGYELAALGLERAEKELVSLEITVPMDIAAAAKARRIAEEDLKTFLEVTLPRDKAREKLQLTDAYYGLEYQQEELDQLEKMYKADDLTEETEELMLKRQRRAVEWTVFAVKGAEIRYKEAIEVTLPRREEDMRAATKHAVQQHEKTAADLPLMLAEKRLSLAQRRKSVEKQAERLENLRADRDLMTVKSPCAGIVYYGRCSGGSWSAHTPMRQAKQSDGALAARQVLMTVVVPRPLFVRCAVPEQQLRHVRYDMEAEITPTAFPKTKMPARVSHVSSVPLGGGFESRIAVDVDDKSGIMPGMNCSVVVVAYRNRKALTVPQEALFTDEEDEGRQYVYVLRKNGKHERRDVTVGEETDCKAEILKGLKKGDEILLEEPENE
jgi:HlyD family secretion protein